MKLRTKLLLGVGLLLFSMVIIMYILPIIFVRRDVYKAATEIHELLIEDHQELIRSQEIWLENIVGSLKQNTDAILFMLYEEPNFSSQLIFDTKNPLVNVWDGIAKIAGYDPDIGFVQAHSPEQNKVAVVTPHSAIFYPIAHRSKVNELTLFAFHHPKGANPDDYIFIGIPLPQDLQREPGYTLFALLDPKEAHVQLSEVKKEFAELSPEEINRRLLDVKQLAIDNGPDKHGAFYWAIKVDLIRTLTPLFVEGLELTKGKTLVPEGLARVDQAGEGFALLTSDIYRTEPIFDDQLYYELHQPPSESPPIADGTMVVTDKKEDHAYFGNTALLKTTYLSIGNPLESLVKQLALSSNKMIVMQIDGNFWIGFNGKGEKLGPEKIENIVKSGALSKKRGIMNLDKNSYFFARISSLEHRRIVFYDFHPLGGDQSIIGTLFSLEDRLTHRISLQLSLISLGTMILVLLFIARIAFLVIYPVTKLAKATEDVVSGRYGDITLPEVGKRKDEVAILTRSFGDMVKGIQEREKIRGVLDKVVSKDVADEILRTQIHLGGEDRVVSILFSDIRGFTKLTENFTPQKTIQMLNECMTKISRVIEGEGGVIDKYVGDEVMAIYGAPTTHPNHGLRAVSSGMLIIETLKKWNQTRRAQNEEEIDMGIGIHTGLVVAGNMGAEDRLNYTVLGSNVNLAARLCEVAKPNQLIISEATLAEPSVSESFYTQALAPISLKGFSEPIQIYEVSGFKWEET